MHSKVIDLPKNKEERLRSATSCFRTDVDYALRESMKLLDEGYEDAYPLAGLAHEKKLDFESAIFYYQRGMEAIGATECWLGKARLCLAGKGVVQDYKEGRRCYEAVLEDTKNPVAPLMLGIIYRHGLGVKQDFAIARKFLVDSAALGSIPARAHLAELDTHQGRWMRGIIGRVRSGVLAWRMLMRSPSDIRLRNDFLVYSEDILRGAQSVNK